MAREKGYKILKNCAISSNMYLMAIASKDIAKKGMPGEFIHIKLPQTGSNLLRRPISINNIDRKKGIVYIAYQVVGKGTYILSKLKRGQKLDILGPLGKGFSISDDVKDIILVGGGCGIAPLRYILDYWPQFSYTSFLGYRDKDAIYQLEEFSRASNEVYITTDDGSVGERGFITEILREKITGISPHLIMACGPILMLRQVQKTAQEYGIPCQISLEERMGCGIGACLVCSCAVKVNNGFEYKRVCADGPVFWSDEVILDDKAKSSC